MNLAQGRALLTAAQAALRVDAREPELLHAWLDTWTSVGLIATGMERQGYRLTTSSLVGGGQHSRALRCSRPMDLAAGPTPWRAVQGAAWEVVGR